jgi:hypothetical protein
MKRLSNEPGQFPISELNLSQKWDDPERKNQRIVEERKMGIENPGKRVER